MMALEVISNVDKLTWTVLLLLRHISNNGGNGSACLFRKMRRQSYTTSMDHKRAAASQTCLPFRYLLQL